MAERVSKKLVNSRLKITSKNLRRKRIIGGNEFIGYESTGSDKYPYRLHIMEMTETSTHILTSLTSNVTWQGLCAAVDAVYEMSWWDNEDGDRSWRLS